MLLLGLSDQIMWLKTVCLIDLSCMCSLLIPLGIWYVSCSSQSTGKIEELLKEDQGVKARREQWQKQAAALSKLTRQLSLHDSQASIGAGLDDSSRFLLHSLFLSLLLICLQVSYFIFKPDGIDKMTVFMCKPFPIIFKSANSIHEIQLVLLC